MKHSEQLNELAAALAKAQGEIKDAIKSTSNEFFNSKYADLHGVLEAVRPALSKNGLALIQGPQNTDEEPSLVKVETMLVHSSGQWISSTFGVKVGGKNPAQVAGSAITYLRRYGSAAMTALAQADDDGNTVESYVEEPVAFINDEEVKWIEMQCDMVNADLPKLLEHLRVEFITDIPSSYMPRIRKLMERKRELMQKDD